MSLLFAGLLFACSSDDRVKDLNNYIADLKKTIVKHTKKDYLAAVKLPIPVVFQSAGKERDPFEGEKASYSGGGALHNPLITFSVKLFEYMGMFEQDNQKWAIIKAPDNKTYQLTIGDRIGDHYGRIIAIKPDHLEVEEQELSTQEAGLSGQAAGKRIVTLQLKGGS